MKSLKETFYMILYAVSMILVCAGLSLCVNNLSRVQEPPKHAAEIPQPKEQPVIKCTECIEI